MNDGTKPLDPDDFHRKVGHQVADKAFSRLTAPDRAALAGVIARQLREVLSCATMDIRDFHVKFGLEYNGQPRALDEEASDFRIRFMQEELDEYKAGVYAGDLAQQFDALIDLMYVLLGTAYLQGFPVRDGWQAVHRANMSKVRAESSDQSKRGSRLDVVKPPNWVPPDIEGIIESKLAYFEAKRTGWRDDSQE